MLILTPAQTREVEEAAIRAGTASLDLMRAAGAGAAKLILDSGVGRAGPRPVSVICGPGANGGDGFVVARRLREAGWPVRVSRLGASAGATSTQTDADIAAAEAGVPIEPFDPAALEGAGLIVDAIFGIGLSRPVTGAAAAMIDAINAHPAPVIALDIPSGVDASSGAVLGVAVEAVQTAVFLALKPGHVLYPGRAYCGHINVVDIGIPAEAITRSGARLHLNSPALWPRAVRRPGPGAHKYARGGVAVVSGPRWRTGAARLAAAAALRGGAGVVTVLSPRAAADENAAHLTAVMVRVADGPEAIGTFLADARFRAVVIGPGAGVDAVTRENVLAVLRAPAAAVLDADALSVFEGDSERLFSALRPGDVMTPHGGEFARLFAGLIERADTKVEAARAAAAKAGAVILLKGPDTVVAAPDGRAAVNVNAPPELATAGSGDVLCGVIAALMAQGAPSFEAAAAGAWLHGAAGAAAGVGMIAEDLPGALRDVLRGLFAPPGPPAPGAADAGGDGRR